MATTSMFCSGSDRNPEQFKALILGNPNYFGNLKESQFEPVLNIQSDTTFEEIGCVGFQPQFNQLEAVVFIKQPSGYGGGICSSGTPEYLRFYLSFDEGATWKDLGLASFTAYDIPQTTESKRLEYAVSLKIEPPQKFCFFRNIALVRAILSWNIAPPPNTPDFTPVWGDIHNTHIQIEPLKLFLLGEIFKNLEIKIPPELSTAVDLAQPVVAPKPKVLSVAELQKIYQDKKVEPHRFALAQVQKLIAQPQVTESLMATGFTGLFSDLDINLNDIISQLFPTDGNTTYEKLECVGLNPNQNMLAGIIRIKKSSGYSGGPCTAGSKEYVTFWADFDNNGTFSTCLGTTSVNVYDIEDIPQEGLEYAVFLPVDLSPYRQPCEDGPKVVKIRAILSWQVAPPCDNPNFIPVWGNREETLIQIQPGSIVEGQVPIFTTVGSVPVSLVDANGLITDAVASTGARFINAPFGGRINIAGKIVNGTAASKYRVMRKPHGAPDSAYVPLTNEPNPLVLTLNTWDPINGFVQDTNFQVHAIDGYYPYQDYASDHFIEGNILMIWYSTSLEDGNAYDLRVDLSVDGNPDHDIHSNAVTVLIDNKAPDVALDIDLGGGVECADFYVGDTFTGHYTAKDLHFGSFSFVIRPSGSAGGVLPVPPAGSHSIVAPPALSLIPDPGIINGTYSLNTTGMKPCGYSLTLGVRDRTNVNSGQTNNYNEVSVGFCLRLPPEG